MKVNDELYVLEVPMHFGNGPARIMNLSLIVDADHGLTLVDTALPLQIEQIEEALANEGFSLDQVKQIVLTHQDIDHVGSLRPLKEKTGVPVTAYVDEVPYIDGTLPMVKAPTPERLAQYPEFAKFWNAFQTTPVDVAVEDGEVLDHSADAVVVATPGHTPGHMSLYLPASKSLIVGDALVSDGGVLAGPSEGATPNMPLALESAKKLAELDVETIVCYHGGLVTEDAKGQLQRVAGVI